MSTLRIDPTHQKMLDKLLARYILRGIKITKKEFIGKLIEKASSDVTFLPDFNTLPPLEEDPAWRDLDICFDLGHPTLSEHVDDLLYQVDDD